MEIVNGEKIIECSNEIKYVFHSIIEFLDLNFIDLKKVVITSGKRNDKFYNNKYRPSWHDKTHGYNAVDFVLLDCNHFKLVSDMYHFIEAQHSKRVGGLISEFEIVRGKGKQHFHIATGTEKETQYFTGGYM